MIRSRALIGFLALVLTGPALADQGARGPVDAPEEATDPEAVDEGEVIEIEPSVKPGSDHSVTEKELERFEDDDIHRILGAVPGVYFREEDGFGLRPNIGMRGSSPERSAKVALMEDGILIAPAPYSAPAAYYFPLVTRMRTVEVVKGPGSIVYGPNTVGGSVNLISADIPRAGQTGSVDLAGGETLYGKLHARYGIGSENAGALIEGVKLRSDGFKDLDGGGDTGFDKTELVLKARMNSDPRASIYHAGQATIGYSEEVSNETYTGLTQADFDDTPNRRYAGTRRDRMEWDHLRWQLSHRLDYETDFSLVTTLYRNSFQRAWSKLDFFVGEHDLAEVLRNPDSGNNPLFYQVLTGQADSTSDAENLVLGTNDRSFVSQGLQTVFHAERTAWPGRHSVDAGLRLHYDAADRARYEDTYAMLGGELMPTGQATSTVLDSLASSRALSVFAQDKVEVGPVRLTAGSRVEVISTDYLDRLTDTETHGDLYAVWIPGAGVYVQATPWLGLLAGVHRGFVPTAPGSGDDIDPELSVNYEAGARFQRWGLSAEAIGFFNDYQNLKGTCTVSSGCMIDQLDDEFNGGNVHTLGLETLIQGQPRAAGLRFPLRANYTLTRAEFRDAFTSDNPQWGDVSPGDRLPYLPTHQLSVQAGVGGVLGPASWELATTVRWHGDMRDVAGRGDIPEAELVPSYTVVDLAASCDLGQLGRAYVTVDNVLDEAYLVSLRPFGARPGKPRLIIFGYKNQF